MDQQGLTPQLCWAVAGRPRPGEAESGDSFAVVPVPSTSPGGQVLVAVVDGLGHGGEAAAAAGVAVAALREHAGPDVEAVVKRCHQALLRTRGVVLTLGLFGADTLSWLGVGNVEGLLLPADQSRPRQAVISRGGIVGFKLPALRAAQVPVARGDTLILATDGIHEGFVSATARGVAVRDVHELAREILARHQRDTDDALVLVARCLGAP